MSARLPQWLFGTVLLLLGHSAFAQTPCNASASWFTSPSFPTEVADNGQTDCVFHQFAWQAFIDVVQARPSGLREFETWMPDYGIFVPAGTPVTPWGQQPNAPCSTNALADAKNAKKLFLRPRVPKGPGAPSDDQATGGTPGALAPRRTQVEGALVRVDGQQGGPRPGLVAGQILTGHGQRSLGWCSVCGQG